MSLGLAMFNKILTENLPLTVLPEHGINREDFVGDRELDVYDMVHAFYNRFNRLPQKRTIREETDVRIVDFPDEPLEYWVECLQNRTRGRLLKEGGKEIRDLAADEDLEGSIARVQQLLYDINRTGVSDCMIPLSNAMDQAIVEHNVKQHAGGLLGISFGFDFLDQVSDGAQGGDTIAVVGRPSTGKTYLLMWMALQAFKAGKQALFFTPEMPVKQCGRRLLALETGTPASFLKMGRVGHFAMQGITNRLQVLFEKHPQRFDLMQGSLSTCVEDLILHVRDVRPDVLYVDGAYLLRTKRKLKAKWERVAEVAEVLKGIALEFDIPVIGAYQFSREGKKKNADISHIAYSDVIGQLASIVIGIRDDDINQQIGWDCIQPKILSLLKGRDGERGKIQILYDMMRMTFTQTQIIEGDTQFLDAG